MDYYLPKDSFLTFFFFSFFLLIEWPLGVVFATQTECPRKFHGISGHTACIPKSPDLIESGISEEDKQLIVDSHNKYRRIVQPPACFMFQMSWDEELSWLSKKWAENCKFLHDPNFQRRIPGKYNVGQNLAHGYRSWQAAMKAWFDEYKDYNYGKISHKGMVGHYTQMVWSTTIKIGCYFSQCKNMPRFYVCNYAPGGNINSQPPYTQCSTGGNLQDCGGKVCYNGGILNPKTCECKCENFNFIYGPQCSLNCTGTQDEPFCSMRKSFCTIYSNIPDTCPYLCNMCPYAGYTDNGESLRPSKLQLLLLFIGLIIMQQFLA